MTRSRSTRLRGFTLIELMNALTLASVLGTLGIYGLARYVRHAKTAEAIGSVQAIAQSAAAYFDQSDSNQPIAAPEAASRAMRHFPPSSRASVPADLHDIRGQRYQSVLADWDVAPWRDLHFSIPQPQCYAYSFTSSGTGAQATATATAQGDLNGDGSMSTYSLSVAPDTKLNAKVSSDLRRSNPEE